MTFTFGSLFSGIGGIDLGLERSGMQCLWQIEIDEYAQKVLQKHWPNVARFRDIRDISPLAGVDLMAGGFPCQDISSAGRRAGITGERSGLWSEFHRLIRELRPRYVLVENVAALLHRGVERVLGDLSASGYDAEWQMLPAAAFGAPHIRERIFIVAYTTSCRHQEFQETGRLYHQSNSPGADVSNPNGHRQRLRTDQQEQQPRSVGQADARTNGQQGIMAYTAGDRWQSWRPECQGQQRELQSQRSSPSLAHPDRQSLAVGQIFGSHARKELATFKRSCSTGSGIWATESNMGRTLDGFSSWLDRHRRLTDETHEYIMANGIIGKTSLGDIHDATSKNLRARKVLRLLRIALEEETIQRTTRGYGRISSEEVLFTYVRQLEKRWADEAWIQLESKETSQNGMRSVRSGNKFDSASYGSEQREQHRGEYTDALQALSRLLARDSEKAWSHYSRENAATLPVWGPGWEDGIARVADGIPARVDKLSGLGNAVIPQIAEYIGRLILERERNQHD